MSFETEKKREYASLADKAMRDGEWGVAAFHFAQASQKALELADRTEGKIRQSYIEEARELVEIAERLRKRAKQGVKTPGAAKPVEEAVSEGEPPQWLVKERPKVTFDDIIGLDNLKMRIKRFVAKFRNPEEVAKWAGARLGDRMILFGPPGTGKTMFAKAIANEIDAAFFQVKGSNLLDKWVGESQKNVKRLFDAVRACERSVVFLDEIDGILSKRGSASTVRDGVVSEFLQEMEGLSSPNSAVLFIGATNLPKELDDAVVSRFGGMFYVPLPPKEARLSFLQRQFAKFPYGHDEQISLEGLADALDGHSMRSLATLVQVLIDVGIAHKLEGSDGKIAKADVDSALKELPAPLSRKDVQAYEKFAAGAN